MESMSPEMFVRDAVADPSATLTGILDQFADTLGERYLGFGLARPTAESPLLVDLSHRWDSPLSSAGGIEVFDPDVLGRLAHGWHAVEGYWQGGFGEDLSHVIPVDPVAHPTGLNAQLMRSRRAHRAPALRSVPVRGTAPSPAPAKERWRAEGTLLSPYPKAMGRAAAIEPSLLRFPDARAELGDARGVRGVVTDHGPARDWAPFGGLAPTVRAAESLADRIIEQQLVAAPLEDVDAWLVPLHAVDGAAEARRATTRGRVRGAGRWRGLETQTVALVAPPRVGHASNLPAGAPGALAQGAERRAQLSAWEASLETRHPALLAAASPGSTPWMGPLPDTGALVASPLPGPATAAGERLSSAHRARSRPTSRLEAETDTSLVATASSSDRVGQATRGLARTLGGSPERHGSTPARHAAAPSPGHAPERGPIGSGPASFSAIVGEVLMPRQGAHDIASSSAALGQATAGQAMFDRGPLGQQSVASSATSRLWRNLPELGSLVAPAATVSPTQQVSATQSVSVPQAGTTGHAVPAHTPATVRRSAVEASRMASASSPSLAVGAIARSIEAAPWIRQATIGAAHAAPFVPSATERLHRTFGLPRAETVGHQRVGPTVPWRAQGTAGALVRTAPTTRRLAPAEVAHRSGVRAPVIGGLAHVRSAQTVPMGAAQPGTILPGALGAMAAPFVPQALNRVEASIRDHGLRTGVTTPSTMDLQTTRDHFEFVAALPTSSDPDVGGASAPWRASTHRGGAVEQFIERLSALDAAGDAQTSTVTSPSPWREAVSTPTPLVTSTAPSGRATDAAIDGASAERRVEARAHRARRGSKSHRAGHVARSAQRLVGRVEARAERARPAQAPRLMATYEPGRLSLHLRRLLGHEATPERLREGTGTWPAGLAQLVTAYSEASGATPPLTSALMETSFAEHRPARSAGPQASRLAQAVGALDLINPVRASRGVQGFMPQTLRAGSARRVPARSPQRAGVPGVAALKALGLSQAVEARGLAALVRAARGTSAAALDGASSAARVLGAWSGAGADAASALTRGAASLGAHDGALVARGGRPRGLRPQASLASRSPIEARLSNHLADLLTLNAPSAPSPTDRARPAAQGTGAALNALVTPANRATYQARLRAERRQLGSRPLAPQNLERALVAHAAAQRIQAGSLGMSVVGGAVGAASVMAQVAAGARPQPISSPGYFVQPETGRAQQVSGPNRATPVLPGRLFGDRGPDRVTAAPAAAGGRRVMVDTQARVLAEQALRSTPGMRPQRKAETNEESRHRLAEDQIDENLSPEDIEEIAQEVMQQLRRALEFDAARTGGDEWD